MVPETWQGKIIASFCALLGISFFALPAVSMTCKSQSHIIYPLFLFFVRNLISRVLLEVTIWNITNSGNYLSRRLIFEEYEK
jgi:hypothetical protein